MAELKGVKAINGNEFESLSISDVKMEPEQAHIVNGSVHYAENRAEKLSQSENGEVKVPSTPAMVDKDTFKAVDVAPADSLTTTIADGAVKIRMGNTPDTNQTPITVVQHMERAVRLAPNKIALAVKREGQWQRWTYGEYYEEVRMAAKSFIMVSTTILLRVSASFIECVSHLLFLRISCLSIY